MSRVTNGIPPDVIREMMPPYHLGPDLLVATFAALPRPPDCVPGLAAGARRAADAGVRHADAGERGAGEDRVADPDHAGIG